MIRSHYRRPTPWLDQNDSDDAVDHEALVGVLRDRRLERLTHPHDLLEAYQCAFPTGKCVHARSPVHADEMYHVGKAYESGDVVAADPWRAKIWYWMGAGKSPAAAERLGVLMLLDDGDRAAALHYLKMAVASRASDRINTLASARAAMRAGLLMLKNPDLATVDDPVALIARGVAQAHSHLMQEDDDLLCRATRELAKREEVPDGVILFGELTTSNRDMSRYAPLAGKPVRRVPFDRAALISALSFDFPWFRDVIAFLDLQLLGLEAKGQRSLHFPPLCLVGGPGIGKNRFCRRFAHHAKAPLGLYNVGGSADNRTFAGTARGYSSGHPAYVVETICTNRVANPIIVIDEIEKDLAGGHNGRVSSTLLQFLERENASRFIDEYLQVNIDLRHVMWILLANDVGSLHPALLSRVRLFRIPEPTIEMALTSVIAGTREDLAAELCQPIELIPTLCLDERDLLVKQNIPSIRALSKAVHRMLVTKISLEMEYESFH